MIGILLLSIFTITISVTLNFYEEKYLSVNKEHFLYNHRLWAYRSGEWILNRIRVLPTGVQQLESLHQSEGFWIHVK